MNLRLILAVVFYFSGAFVQAAFVETPSFKDPTSTLQDPDENFVKDIFEPNVQWSTRMQDLYLHIKSDLILPPSNIRSFILTMEHQLPLKQNLNTKFMRLSKKSFDAMSDEQKDFVRDIIAGSDGVNPLAISGGAFIMLQNPRIQNPQFINEFDQKLNEFAEAGAGKQNRVAMLIGDPGASGVTSLVSDYAKYSKRNLVRLFAPNLYHADLADQIRAAMKIPNSILLFEEIHRYSPPAQELIQLLLAFPDLAGNQDIVVTGEAFGPLPTKDPNAQVMAHYGLNHLSGFAFGADSIHIIKRPMNPVYFEEIVRLNWRPAIRNIAAKHKKQAPASEPDKAVVQNLASALFDHQEKKGISAIRDMYNIMYYPILNPCEAELKGMAKNSDYSLPLFEQAQAYADFMAKLMETAPAAK